MAEKLARVCPAARLKLQRLSGVDGYCAIRGEKIRSSVHDSQHIRWFGGLGKTITARTLYGKTGGSQHLRQASQPFCVDPQGC